MRQEYFIERVTPDFFKVRKNNGSEYFVDLAEKHCTCPAFHFKKKCKHLTMCKGIKNKKEIKDGMFEYRATTMLNPNVRWML